MKWMTLMPVLGALAILGGCAVVPYPEPAVVVAAPPPPAVVVRPAYPYYAPRYRYRYWH